MIPCSVSRAVMDLTVRSDLPISLATNFCGTDGYCCITRNKAISSKVQFLHFVGRPRAKFALVNVDFLHYSPQLMISWPVAVHDCSVMRFHPSTYYESWAYLRRWKKRFIPFV